MITNMVVHVYQNQGSPKIECGKPALDDYFTTASSKSAERHDHVRNVSCDTIVTVQKLEQLHLAPKTKDGTLEQLIAR